MSINPSLEKELMNDLRELNQNEQDAIKVFCAMYENSCEKLKNEKLESLEKSLIEQIKFYGRKKDEYSDNIRQITEKYTNLIDQMAQAYHTWLGAIILDLQDVYNNQKIAIANAKISIGLSHEGKKLASEEKINNYEIVAQECKRQMAECKDKMSNHLNEIFYAKDKSLSTKKGNIFQKFMNIFSGKSKVSHFVIAAMNQEINDLENKVKAECENVENWVVEQVAMVENAILQTQELFNQRLKENGYYES